MQEERDLGGQREQVSNGSVGTSGETMSAQDERTWSIIAHASVLAGLVGLMPFGALIVWLLYKDRSERVRFHALQALWYQIAWVVILVAYTFVSAVLSLVIIGIFMFFLLPILALIPLVHGCYAAYQVSQGIEYRYPYIADRIEGPRSVA
ncbi:MAG TPA: DUF4870 domain-containing protein [Rubrobacter sp.]